jgi:hypothetical protein
MTCCHIQGNERQSSKYHVTYVQADIFTTAPVGLGGIYLDVDPERSFHLKTLRNGRPLHESPL